MIVKTPAAANTPQSMPEAETVRVSVANLMTFPWIAKPVAAGRLALQGYLFDIHTGEWDETLLQLFRVPRALLPEVRDNAAEFGATETELLGAPIPIRGMAGDQQAATIGQACFTPGMIKSTYGTGRWAPSR